MNEVIQAMETRRSIRSYKPDMFRAMPAEALSSSLFTAGWFAVPAFSMPTPNWAAVIAIMPIAIATIPESTAHIYQIDIYVNELARKKNSKKKYDLASLLDLNLIGDGLCDMHQSKSLK